MKPFEELSTAAFEPARSASSGDTFDPEPLLHAFEQAWQEGDTPPIETVLERLPEDGPATESARRGLLVQMVKIDLEYRWRDSKESGDSLPARPLLEDYLRRFPALGTLDQLALDLIGVEYRVRHLWGDRPQAETYFARFPGHGELPSLLARIDAELAGNTLATTGESGRGSRVAPVLGGYEILGELGRGGMGVVYQARQRRLNRLVAIKMIRGGDQPGPAELARFHTEAEAAARVQHPHVVQVYEVGDKDGQPFCVMEYVNGGSLSRRLAGTPLEPRAAARLLETLSRAVQTIHDQGILHRDLKPANILLHLAEPDDRTPLTADSLQSPGCVPKISDFGLARPVEASGLTQSGALLGTPSYMAPEQAESRSEAISPATDVYGLGAILYELLTGRPPFRGVTVLETLEQVRKCEPLPPRQLQPAVPLDLETICLKCLQKEPYKRYGSAAALADDLERYRLNRPIQARPVGRWERGMKWARRRPALATLAAAVLLGLLAALAGGLTYTLHLRAARAETEHQRQQAGRSYQKALQAVDQMLVRMGAHRMNAIPGTEKALEAALQDAVRLYEELLDEQERPDPDLYVRLSYARAALGNWQMGLGQSDEAENSSRRSVELMDHLPDELRDSRASRHQSAFARYILATILGAKLQRAEAERLYHEGCDILASLNDDRDTRDLLAHCYTGLGQLNNELDRIGNYYRQAMELTEKIHKEDPDNWYYRNRYGEALFNRGQNALSAARTDEAETLFQRCLDLLEPFVALRSGVNDEPALRIWSQQILVHCYTGLGIVWSNRGQFAKSESFHHQAIALSEQFVKMYPHPERRHDLAQGYLNLGAMYQIGQQRKKAEEVYRKAIPLLEALVHDLPDIPSHRLTLAQTYANLALILPGAQKDEALSNLQRGRDVLEPSLRSHPDDSRVANDYGNLCHNQALVIFHHGEPRKALPYHDRAVEVLSDAYRLHPHDLGCAERYARALASRAQTWTALKEHKKALADWDRVVEVATSPEDDKYRYWRAAALLRLGDHRQAAEDIDKVLRRPRVSNDERYKCVGLLNLTLVEAQKDSHLTADQRQQAEDRYAARALEELTFLKQNRYFSDLRKFTDLIASPELATLRTREDFKRWCLRQTDR